MGLDSVELVMEVEKTFNISIPDEEASQCGVNRKEMELVINQIIADKAGFEIGEIAPHHKFGDDLGLD